MERSRSTELAQRIMRDSRFEPEAASDGEMNECALMVPQLVGTTTVRSESGYVEMERSVRMEVREIPRALPPGVDFVDRR